MKKLNKIEEVKKEFLEICSQKIKREGINDLIAWLLSTDFFTAPASRNQHLDFEGGLAEHSINVYKRLRNLVESEYGNFETISEESIALCGLMHDLCKIDFYKIDYRNVKENGVWIQKPYYTIEDKLPYGHGEKSVYIINGFLRLTRDEALAINWHMGGFDDRVKGGSYAIGEAYKRHTLALLLHLADITATYIDENSLLNEKKVK